jgi:polyhydroxybutyrate depolymerase
MKALVQGLRGFLCYAVVVLAGQAGCTRHNGQLSGADLSVGAPLHDLSVGAPGPTLDFSHAADGAVLANADLLPNCDGRGGTPGDSTVMIEVASGNRSYLLHIPPQYQPSTPMPLIVALHGLTNTDAEMRDLTHFNVVGDQRGYIVAYPQGLTDAWNGGACCGLPVADNTDDVGFVSALIAQVEDNLCVDLKRVYATGFSNGGFMAHRLGCQLSDQIAAIGVASGEEAIPSCTPSRPVPVVQTHGTADPLVPYDGNPLLGFPSTMTTMTGWAMRDGCATTTTTIGVVGAMTCISWNGCAGGSNVVLCTDQGGDHEWFGGGSLWVNNMPPATGFVTTTYFADFFDAHPMP